MEKAIVKFILKDKGAKKAITILRKKNRGKNQISRLFTKTAAIKAV